MIRTAFSIVLAFLAASCGNTGTEPTSTRASIAVTDAPTDEVEVFEVGVREIVLTRLDDSTVRVLTQSTRVDFAALESLTELLVGATIPLGTYKSVSMTLEFADARVELIDKTTPATVVDANDVELTGNVVLSVTFPDTARPVAVVGRNHLFLLDLDLNESLTVDLTNNKVTFVPVATAVVDPTNRKPVVTTGLLKSVDTGIGRLEVERRTPSGVVIGTYVVDVSPTTVYQVGGVSSVGTTGLTALSLLPANSRILVQGSLSTRDRTLNATAIEAGIGIRGGGQDWILGHITARDLGANQDPTLTVRGRSLQVTSGVRRLNTDHTVTVDRFATRVVRRLSGERLTADALNVGQRVMIFGSLSGTVMNARTGTSVVRMLRTDVWGTVTTTPTGGLLTLDLQRIGLRPIRNFDFSVNGAVQTTPTAFTIDTGTLSLGGIDTGARVRAVGIFNPVDVTTDQDMTAETVVNRSNAGGLLLCQWNPATTAPFSATSDTQLTLDVSAASIRVVGNGFGTSTLTNTTPAKLKSLLGAGVFRIIENGAVETHLLFSSFVTSLNSRISNESPVFRIGASGTFEPVSQTLSALTISVTLR